MKNSSCFCGRRKRRPYMASSVAQCFSLSRETKVNAQAKARSYSLTATVIARLISRTVVLDTLGSVSV